ncbi:hypothetical protein Ccrd_021449 [Cynara cardunculus var. scolymus]|uniref:Uncharacterized protein n=1 Tax=Cynara cardunculus var. scolymus TaxID=59895 RepID=A0A118K075_CYNCS|nr:hypothetical protein Ccrd_021449 [Cynara cardunculus var. scolymus]
MATKNRWKEEVVGIRDNITTFPIVPLEASFHHLTFTRAEMARSRARKLWEWVGTALVAFPAALAGLLQLPTALVAFPAALAGLLQLPTALVAFPAALAGLLTALVSPQLSSLSPLFSPTLCSSTCLNRCSSNRLFVSLEQEEKEAHLPHIYYSISSIRMIVPLKPTAIDATAITAGPATNLATIPYAANLFPQAISFDSENIVIAQSKLPFFDKFVHKNKTIRVKTFETPSAAMNLRIDPGNELKGEKRDGENGYESVDTSTLLCINV